MYYPSKELKQVFMLHEEEGLLHTKLENNGEFKDFNEEEFMPEGMNTERDWNVFDWELGEADELEHAKIILAKLEVA